MAEVIFYENKIVLKSNKKDKFHPFEISKNIYLLNQGLRLTINKYY